jgi:HD-like signal output (HDOD) protein
VVGAIAGATVARHGGGDESLAFTAALLRDIGKLLLSSALVQRFHDEIYQLAELTEESIVTLEQALLGVDHAQAGARLLEMWRLPEPIVWSVRQHHAPARPGPHSGIASQVHLADLVCRSLSASPHVRPDAETRDRHLLSLGLTPQEYDSVVSETRRALLDNRLVEMAA